MITAISTSIAAKSAAQNQGALIKSLVKILFVEIKRKIKLMIRNNTARNAGNTPPSKNNKIKTAGKSNNPKTK